MNVLETKRLVLRPFIDDDYPAVFEMMTCPEVMKYTSFRLPQTKKKIQSSFNEWKKLGLNSLGVWCVEDKENKGCVGWYMLKGMKAKEAEIGFMFHKKIWGNGFAREMGEAIIGYGFKELKLKKIIARVDKANKRSIKSLEGIGMKIQLNPKIEGFEDKIMVFETLNSIN